MAYYPPYVPVRKKRAKAEKKLKQLRKKIPDIQPVWIEGQALARTWWGKEWNHNLERYADFENRIGRGRSYLRHRAVLDLRIEPGEARALVLGSASAPYEVTIRIKPLDRKNRESIKAACAGRIDSMTDLLAGRFPKRLSDLFTEKGSGLFPSPKEISFDCDCPDWAYMCKHVAAALYAVGARLDEDPSLFFRLRKVGVEDLISEAVAESADRLLEKAARKSDQISNQIMDDADLGDMFGIEMDEGFDFSAAGDSAAGGVPGEMPGEMTDGMTDEMSDAPAGMEADKEVNPAKRGKKPKRKKAPGKTAAFISRSAVAEKEMKRIMEAIRSSGENGLQAADIHALTDIPVARTRSLLQRAMNRGLVVRISRGVYGINKETAVPANPAVMVLRELTDARDGISLSRLAKQTGIRDVKLRVILYRLLKAGKIRRVARGIYMASE